MSSEIKKKRHKSARQKLKETCWNVMAKFIKLRDAIEDRLDPDFRFVRCRTCGKVLERYYFENGKKKSQRNCQGGHYKSRGSGGQSGIYFDERACATQCVPCNGFEQGKPKEFKEYLVNKYGEEVVEELELKHKTHSYSDMDIIALEEYYKQEYKKLCEQYKVKENK